MWCDGEHQYAYAYAYQTMTPDQAAFVIQQAWRDYVYHLYEYEDEISFYDLYPDRPMDYEGMSQVNIEYEYWQWYPTQGLCPRLILQPPTNPSSV